MITIENSNEVDITLDSTYFQNLTTNLARVLVVLLSDFKQKNMSSPIMYDEDIPKDFKGGIHDRWNYILGEMLWAFTAYAEETVNVNNYLRVKNGLRLFAKYYSELWS